MTYSDAIVIGVVGITGVMVYLGVQVRKEHKILSYVFFLFAFLNFLNGSAMLIDILVREI